MEILDTLLISVIILGFITIGSIYLFDKNMQNK